MLKEFNTKQPSAIKGCHLTPILYYSVKNLQTFYIYLPTLRFVESRVSITLRIHGQFSSGSYFQTEAKILTLFSINSFNIETRFLENSNENLRLRFVFSQHGPGRNAFLQSGWPSVVYLASSHLRVIILKLHLSYYAFCLTLH